MTKIPFTLVDVFAARPFSGNQLPVILEADGLSGEQMHQIAREFELSETSFVIASEDPRCDWRVRFWTPYEEVPVAGHPLVGTAIVLANLGMVESKMVLETETGPVSIEVDAEGMAWISQPPAQFGATHEDRGALAAALSLDPSDLDPDLPAQILSCGHEFLFVPVASIDSMRRISADPTAWDAALGGFSNFAFCFSREAEGPGMDAHCRLLAPHDIASGEDAASGSAAGPLAAYLWQHLLGGPAGDHSFAFEQGVEMGRPSELHVSLRDYGKELSVGGQAAFVADGHIAVPEV